MNVFLLVGIELGGRVKGVVSVCLGSALDFWLLFSRMRDAGC